MSESITNIRVQGPNSTTRDVFFHSELVMVFIEPANRHKLRPI